MKKERRKKVVEYNVYIASDGTEFESKKRCKLYERLLNGEIEMCPICGGDGRRIECEEWENYHTGALETALTHRVCKTCGGKGYIEKNNLNEMTRYER